MSGVFILHINKKSRTESALYKLNEFSRNSEATVSKVSSEFIDDDIELFICLVSKTGSKDFWQVQTHSAGYFDRHYMNNYFQAWHAWSDYGIYETSLQTKGENNDIMWYKHINQAKYKPANRPFPR